jgi:hypothetical protein
MNHETRNKLQRFLNEKTHQIYRETREEKAVFDLAHIKTMAGFDVKEETRNLRNDKRELVPYEDKYTIFKRNDPSCLLKVGIPRERGRVDACMGIDDIWGYTYTFEKNNVGGMVTRCLDEMDAITKELRALRAELEKQEKINDIAKNGINTWLKVILQNQPHPYYTTVAENKITLSIQLKNRLQLNIPIYFARFQKIMPNVLETIQQFGDCVNKGNMKITISNTSANQQWQTPTSNP